MENKHDEAPLVAGGQGRTATAVEASAWAVLGAMLAAAAVVIGLAVAS